MSNAQLEVARGAGFVAAAVVALLLQRMARHAGDRGSWPVNGLLWAINAAVIGVVCGGCAFTTARWAAREGMGLLPWAGTGAWVALAVSVGALDLVSYAWHRANHHVWILWRFHRVHHSDPAFTTSTAVRFHPGELLLALPVRLGAIVVVGASAEAVLAFELLFTLANLVEHGDINLPLRLERVLDRVLVTPALHRRHHTQTGPVRDTNFGTIFSCWDRLAGTLTPSDSATMVRTGLPDLDHVTLGDALALPLRKEGSC